MAGLNIIQRYLQCQKKKQESEYEKPNHLGQERNNHHSQYFYVFGGLLS
jgi:hypothetical protein